MDCQTIALLYAIHGRSGIFALKLSIKKRWFIMIPEFWYYTSSGKYLTFADSADYVDECFVECLYTKIQESGARISCAGLQNFSDEDVQVVDTEQPKIVLYQRKDVVVALFDESKSGKYACNKIENCLIQVIPSVESYWKILSSLIIFLNSVMCIFIV